jgi:lipopolysaccharide transport system ATP-binding protein
MSSDVAVALRGVSKSYPLHASGLDRLRRSLGLRGAAPARHDALRDVSIQVERGESFGIAGRNGSGKSTLLQIAAGILSPSSGEVEVRGRCAALLELGAGFHPELTGRENVYINGMLLGLSRLEVAERMQAITDFADIGEYVDQPVKTYSSGMFVRLAFAVSVHVEADVLVVDEALAVGDEAFQRKCFARIEQLSARGATILIVSHSAAALMELCDRVLLLDRGERLLVGSPKSVLSRYHRLLYAPPEQADQVRDEIRRLDQGASDEAAEVASLEETRSMPSETRSALEEERFDAELCSRSSVSYVPRGARIRDVRIANEAGEAVNVLRRGHLYFYEYVVDFSAPAFGVRFGMLIKNTLGTEFGGLSSHPVGAGLASVTPGSSLGVRIPFRARLAPGTYFANAGVVALVEGGEQFLHRILDAVVFRIANESDLCVTVAVDFSADREPRIWEEHLGAAEHAP